MEVSSVAEKLETNHLRLLVGLPRKTAPLALMHSQKFLILFSEIVFPVKIKRDEITTTRRKEIEALLKICILRKGRLL